jgi:hypothetical protein
MLLVGFFLLLSMAGMVDRAGSGGAWSAFSSIEFILLLLAECGLFGAWVVACEVAANRQDNEAEQVRTRNLMRELAGRNDVEGEGEPQEGSGAKLTVEQVAEREARQAAKGAIEGPHMWIAVVVLAMAVLGALAVNGL